MQTGSAPQNQALLVQAILDIEEVIRLFQSAILEYSRKGLEVNAQGGLELAVNHQFSSAAANDLAELIRRYNFYLGELQRELQKKAGRITIHGADIRRWLEPGIEMLSAMWPDEWDEELYGALVVACDGNEACLDWDDSLPKKIITMLGRVNYHWERFCRQAKRQMEQAERLEQGPTHLRNGNGVFEKVAQSAAAGELRSAAMTGYQKEVLAEIIREFQRFIRERSGHFLKPDATGKRRALPRLEVAAGKLRVSEEFKASGRVRAKDPYPIRDYYLGEFEKYELELIRATSLAEVEILLAGYFEIGSNVMDTSLGNLPSTKLDFVGGLLKCVWLPGNPRFSPGEPLRDLKIDQLNVLLARLRNPPDTQKDAAEQSKNSGGGPEKDDHTRSVEEVTAQLSVPRNNHADARKKGTYRGKYLTALKQKLKEDPEWKPTVKRVNSFMRANPHLENPKTLRRTYFRHCQQKS